MEDERPYVIERSNSPGREDGRVRFMPLGREMCRMHGMTEIEMARHLLQQEKQREAGLTQHDGES